MASLKRLINRQRNANRTSRRIKMRNHLNADVRFGNVLPQRTVTPRL